MGLIYTELNDLLLKNGDLVRRTDINKIFKKLIDNDNSILPNFNDIPGIWTCKWFNNELNNGYKPGDGVWINTEDENQFIFNFQDEILGYINGNQKLKRDFQYYSEKSSDTQIMFFKKVINGYTFSDGQKLTPLYYIGDITQPVQLRVCIKPDEGKQYTKSLPTDNEHWMDFFKNSEENDKLFNTEKERVLNNSLQEHINRYHITCSLEKLSSDYVSMDLSNLDQKSFQLAQVNMKKPLNIQGFDFIKLFITKTLNNGTQRWFRLWNSGYLEHGGTINIKNISEFDEIIYNGKCCKVKLNWTYQNGENEIESPTFTYDLITGNSFYQDEEYIFDTDTKYNKDDNISDKNRYVIQITPQFITSGNPFKNNIFTEINTINNNNFSFRISENCDSYSYYCCGFTIGNIYKNLYEFKFDESGENEEPQKYCQVTFISSGKKIASFEIQNGFSFSDIMEIETFNNLSKNIDKFYAWSTLYDNKLIDIFSYDTIVNSDLTLYARTGESGEYADTPNFTNSTQINITGDRFTIKRAEPRDTTYVLYDGADYVPINQGGNN